MTKLVLAGILIACIFAGAVSAKSNIEELKTGVLAQHITALSEAANY